MSRRITILTALLISTMALHAQKVTDVQFDQEGSRVKVSYTLNQRIANISLSYSTNGGATFTKLRKVEGDVGERIEPGHHVIYWNANEEIEELESDQVIFRVDCTRATPLHKTFIILNGTYHLAPQWGMGITLGQVKKVGWYINFLTNFNSNYENDGMTTKNGYYNGQYPFYSGESQKAYYAASAGLTVRLGEPTWLYLGAGYSNRLFMLKTLDDMWYAQSAASHSGFSVDLGLMIAIEKFILSFGVHSIGIDYLEFKGGIGLNF